MNELELYHRGIKGQKWGIRRYQNEDGSLTAEGRERYGIKGQRWGARRYQNEDGTLTAEGQRRYSESKKGVVDQSKYTDAQKQAFKNNFVKSEVASDWTNLQNAQQQSSNALNSASRIMSKSAARDQTKYTRSIDVSEMDDKTLQAAVNRMNMERNYKSLVAADIGAGKRNISDILGIAGDVLAVGASAASIALSIYQIKNGKVSKD